MINHGEMVKCLAKDGAIIQREMSPLDAHIMHMAIGVCGESGELMDTIKKCVIYRKELDRSNIVEELGDLEFYMEGLRQALHITREETIDANIAKLSVRYSSGKFSDAQAVARMDKNDCKHI